MPAILIAVFCAVMQSTSPAPGKTANNAAHTISGPPKALNNENPADIDIQKSQNKSANDAIAARIQEVPGLVVREHWQDGIYWILDVLLILVGSAAFVAVWYQAKETARAAKAIQISAEAMQRQIGIMEKQTKATEDAAATALLNAQAVIHSERPWIIVTVEPHPSFRGNFLFAATNKGRTPAKLVSGSAEFTFTALPKDLPVPPSYSSQFTSLGDTLLVPGDPFQIYSPSGISPEDIVARRSSSREIANPNETLIFYGRIVYRDGFGKGNLTDGQHETRWCYAYVKNERRFVITGPDEYNRHT